MFRVLVLVVDCIVLVLVYVIFLCYMVFYYLIIYLCFFIRLMVFKRKFFENVFGILFLVRYVEVNRLEDYCFWKDSLFFIVVKWRGYMGKYYG